MKFPSNRGVVCPRTAKFLGMYLVALVMVLALSAGSAWSFDKRYSAAVSSEKNYNSGAVSRSMISPSAQSVADQCLSLLKQKRHLRPLSGMDSATDSAFKDLESEAAGKAAVLSLVVGIRYALAPAEALSAKEQTDNTRHALNKVKLIAAYRQCEKQNALAAFQVKE